MQARNAQPPFAPAYLALLERGTLAGRASAAWRHLQDCDLCARYCRVSRLETLKGVACRTGAQAVVRAFDGGRRILYPC